MKILSFFENLFARLFIVAGAFIGSQVPQFMQQYTERLAGHVEALQKLINQLYQMATLSHKNLDQYIQKFKESSDLDFNRQGDFMQGIVNRCVDLNQILEHLTESPFWQHPFYFFKDFQPDIAHSTLIAFQPGFNFTIEGLTYGLIGVMFGWGLYEGIKKLFIFGYASIQSLFKKNI